MPDLNPTQSSMVGRLGGCGRSIKSGRCGDNGICSACWDERQTYDSRPDTWAHIDQVRRLLSQIMADFQQRSDEHDKTKLEEPELSIFNEFTPKLRHSTYGSEEYEGFRAAMGTALDHHYAAYRHHPEHFEDGIHEMNLVDVLEMLADWKAATLRHADGDLKRSIVQNAERFGYGPEFARLLSNTARDMGWLDG